MPIPQHRTIPCPVCKRRFESEDGLRHHQVTAHGGSPGFVCHVPGCNRRSRRFQSERSLTRHYNDKHTAPIILPCTKVMSKREEKVLKHAHQCSVCNPQMDFVKNLLGIEGVRKRGRKPKAHP